MTRFVRILLVLVGLVAIAVGAKQLLPALPNLSALVSAISWGLGPAVLSDLVLMPAIAIVGWVLSRAVPERLRASITVGLILSLSVLAIAWPFLGGFGSRPDNPSLLDLNYRLGVGLVLAIIWLLVALSRVRQPSSDAPGVTRF